MSECRLIAWVSRGERVLSGMSLVIARHWYQRRKGRTPIWQPGTSMYLWLVVARCVPTLCQHSVSNYEADRHFNVTFTGVKRLTEVPFAC